jgi:HK97 gp10 family phage protein
LRALAGDDAVKRVGKALFDGAEGIAVEAQLSITRGAVSGKNHVPSAPGQPPNNDSGVLAGNIEATQLGPLRARVASEASYAAALEFGTSKMEARPYMRPARDKEKAGIKTAVTKAMNEAVRASKRSD